MWILIIIIIPFVLFGLVVAGKAFKKFLEDSDIPAAIKVVVILFMLAVLLIPVY